MESSVITSPGGLAAPGGESRDLHRIRNRGMMVPIDVDL